MIRGNKNEAYPILNGEALIKVNIRKKADKVSFYSKMKKKIRHFLINKELNAYFPENYFNSVPIVNLNDSKVLHSYSLNGDYEFNMVTDVISPYQKMKLAFGGIVAAGIIAVSTFSLMGKTDVNQNVGNNSSPGVNISGVEIRKSSDNRAKTPLLISQSENEKVLLASLSNPMNNYPFKRLAGHSNLPASTHTNISGQNQHTNVLPNPSHTDTGGGHTNTPHTNYSGHNNGVEHTNSYTDSP